MACLFGALPSQAQVRPDINDPNLFNSARRTELFNLMIQYIDGPILQEHCNMTMITGGMIHSVSISFAFTGPTFKAWKIS